MTRLDLQEKIDDGGHDSASDLARSLAQTADTAAAEAAARDAGEPSSDDRPKRAPRYNVFERVTLYTRGRTHKIRNCKATEGPDGVAVHEHDVDRADGARATSVTLLAAGDEVEAWALIAEDVSAANGRLAIEQTIGTHETPVDGFDDERRLHRFVAVHVGDWQPRQRKREVQAVSAEERAELERRLAGTVTESWIAE